MYYIKNEYITKKIIESEVNTKEDLDRLHSIISYLDFDDTIVVLSDDMFLETTTYKIQNIFKKIKKEIVENKNKLNTKIKNTKNKEELFDLSWSLDKCERDLDKFELIKYK